MRGIQNQERDVRDSQGKSTLIGRPKDEKYADDGAVVILDYLLPPCFPEMYCIVPRLGTINSREYGRLVGSGYA